MLGQPVPIMRGCVKKGQTRPQAGNDGRDSSLFVQLGEEIAEGCGAEAQSRNLKPCAAQRAERNVHAIVPKMRETVACVSVRVEGNSRSFTGKSSVAGCGGTA